MEILIKYIIIYIFLKAAHVLWWINELSSRPCCVVVSLLCLYFGPKKSVHFYFPQENLVKFNLTSKKNKSIKRTNRKIPYTKKLIRLKNQICHKNETRHLITAKTRRLNRSRFSATVFRAVFPGAAKRLF